MATYNEASFKVLRGLDPVRQRPGMYTNLESPNHIMAEVVDNACDEALAGYAKNIHVTAHTDGSVSVMDDGRGIPVGIHKEEGRSVVEVAFTVLHSGGKFDKETDGAYKFAGGLHGVGVAVTNALSKKVEVTVFRDGGQYDMRFLDGVAEKPLVKTGSCPKKQTGTAVRAWPNPKYFDSPNVNLAQLEHSLRSKAVLLPGITITLNLEKTGETKSWTYPDGLRGYLAEALSEFELATPILLQEKFTRKDDGSGFAEGEGASWALTWSAEGNVVRESYVNLIPTPSGGTHEAGLREGVFNAVKSFAELHGLLPKGVKLVAEDVFSRSSFVLSAKVLDPQFQGQTKEKLVSRDALRLVSSMIKDPLDLWLNEHIDCGQEDRRTGDPAGAGTFALGAKSRKEKRFQRRGAARQAHRLQLQRSVAHRTLPGRGRLGGRFGQAGTQQGIPGCAAPARQSAEHLRGGERPPVRQ